VMFAMCACENIADLAFVFTKFRILAD